MYGFRIFHPTAKTWIKKSVQDFFAIYAGLGIFTTALTIYVYDNWEGRVMPRYRNDYTIMRPTDFETKMYPRHFITDNHLLPADHPTELKDCISLPEGAKVLDKAFKKISFN